MSIHARNWLAPTSRAQDRENALTLPNVLSPVNASVKQAMYLRMEHVHLKLLQAARATLLASVLKMQNARPLREESVSVMTVSF